MIKKVLLTICLLFILTGCYQDSTTGKWRLSPLAADKIENAGETGVGILNILSAFIPELGIAAAGAGGVLATFKKMKKKVTKYKTPMEHSVATLEIIKEEQPELWLKIKDKFKKGTNADIEAVIDETINILKKQGVK